MASNAVYLANKGFTVHAFDSSAAAVRRASARAQALGLSVRVWCEDLAMFTPAIKYDAILCRGVLHFLKPEQWDRAIAAMQRGTASAGWNALSVFDDSLPIPPDLLPIVHRVARRGELREMYSRWEVIQDESYCLCDEHSGGVRHSHGITRFLARRVTGGHDQGDLD
jgi:hypothetical protein